MSTSFRRRLAALETGMPTTWPPTWGTIAVLCGQRPNLAHPVTRETACLAHNVADLFVPKGKPTTAERLREAGYDLSPGDASAAYHEAARRAGASAYGALALFSHAARRIEAAAAPAPTS